MPNNNMAFSLIFKIVDGATAKIREIAQVMGEPIAATTALGDASEASSARQVSAFARARAALDNLSDGITRPAARLIELGRDAGEAAEKFSKSFAGIGAIAAEGFSVKDVAQQEEFFKRLQINAAMSKVAMEDLREAIGRAADQYAVPKEKMLAALQAYREQGGDPAKFGENAANIAATMQLTQMDPEHAGQQLASLARLGITDPKEVISVLAQMREQLGGVPERMDAAAEASGRLVAAMQSLHMTGAQGALALNAVYGVAARSTGNARLARSETDNWLSQLADRGYQAQLSQALGKRITDANGFVMDPRTIMQMVAQKYADAQKLPQNQQAVAIQRLNALVGDDAAKMFRSVGGEIATTGHSSTIEQVLGSKGDSASYLKSATDASNTLSGAFTRLREAMDRASEAVLTTPLNLLTDALNSCGGAVGYVVVGIAGLVAIGQIITWTAGAINGFKLLAAALSTTTRWLIGLPFRLLAAKVATEGLAVAEGEAAVATEAMGGTSIIGWLGGIVAGMGAAATATWGFTAALLANPITWVVLLITGLAVGIYELWNHWDTVWTHIKGFFSWFSDTVDSMFKTPFLGAITAVMSPLTAMFELPKLFGSTWSDWFATMGSAFDTLLSKVNAYIDRAATAGGLSPDAVKGAVQGAALGGTFGLPGALIGGLIGGLTGSGGTLKTAQGAPSADDMAAYFRSKGWSGAQAAGIASNLYSESKFNAGAVGDHGQAYGIAQWHADRQKQFANVFRHSIQGTSWQDQAAFVDWELRHTEHRAGNALSGAGSAAQAGAIMSEMYERPANAAAEAARRAQIAMQIAGGKGSAAVAGTGATAVAANDAGAPYATGPSSIYGQVGAGLGTSGPAVPAHIFGGGTASADAAPLGDGSASLGGSANPRAHVTIELKDPRGQAKARIDHTSDMDAHLDRGPSMSLSWG